MSINTTVKILTTGRKLIKTNALQKAGNASDDVFNIWSRRALGGANPLTPDDIKDLHNNNNIIKRIKDFFV